MRKPVLLSLIVLGLLLVVAAGCKAPSENGEEVIKQVEPSQVVAPQLELEVQQLEIEGDSEASFLGEIMNQMVKKLKE